MLMVFGKLKKKHNEIIENAPNADERKLNLEAKKLMRQHDIEGMTYREFLKSKGVDLNKNTPELVNEYLTDCSWVKQYDIDCWVQLNESYMDVNNYAGAALSGGRSNFTMSNRKKLEVKTVAYIADKGVVFKKAINKAEDLRLPWETITSVSVDGKKGEIVCDNVTYVVQFLHKQLCSIFFKYVEGHMSGVADDGWN